FEMDRLVGKSRALADSTGRPQLEQRRTELLAETQAPNLWDDPTRAAEVIRAFRTVEAQINELERLEAAVLFARRLVREAKNEVQLGSAAKQVEDVAREVQMAEALHASGATTQDTEALVDICASDSAEAQETWVQELATMYLGWAQRRGYEAVAVAEAEEPSRVVVRIAGPGAYGFLAGEAGMHRRLEDEKRQRAYVRVHRGGSLSEEELAYLEVQGRPMKSHEGAYLQRVRTEVTVKDESSGRVLTLTGATEIDELKDIAARVVYGQGSNTDEARRYYLGRGARVEDPRTGAGTPRVKDVLRGELDVFIAAWISRRPRSPRHLATERSAGRQRAMSTTRSVERLSEAEAIDCPSFRALSGKGPRATSCPDGLSTRATTWSKPFFRPMDWCGSPLASATMKSEDSSSGGGASPCWRKMFRMCSMDSRWLFLISPRAMPLKRPGTSRRST
ncbi:PCRF domain-containing protein, partial [Myxococcus sp. 1LA]